MDVDTRLEVVKKILQEWTDKQGHERCWYYPDLFRQLCTVLDVKIKVEPKLPPLAEFKKGCEKYQQEEFNNSKRM